MSQRQQTLIALQTALLNLRRYPPDYRAHSIQHHWAGAMIQILGLVRGPTTSETSAEDQTAQWRSERDQLLKATSREYDGHAVPFMTVCTKYDAPSAGWQPPGLHELLPLWIEAVEGWDTTDEPATLVRVLSFTADDVNARLPKSAGTASGRGDEP